MTPKELTNLFRANLKSIREKAGLSQSELARRAGKKPSYICDVERGRRTPTVATLANLSAALRVSPASLISAKQVKKSPPASA